MSRRRRELEALAARFGRHVIKKRKHFFLVCNRGERPKVVTSSTPGDGQRGMKNLVRDLKRADISKEEYHNA